MLATHPTAASSFRGSSAAGTVVGRGIVVDEAVSVTELAVGEGVSAGEASTETTSSSIRPIVDDGEAGVIGEGEGESSATFVIEADDNGMEVCEVVVGRGKEAEDDNEEGVLAVDDDIDLEVVGGGTSTCDPDSGSRGGNISSFSTLGVIAPPSSQNEGAPSSED